MINSSITRSAIPSLGYWFASRIVGIHPLRNICISAYSTCTYINARKKRLLMHASRCSTPGQGKKKESHCYCIQTQADTNTRSIICRSQAPFFFLEGSTAHYKQEDHQLSSHTEIYLHTAVNMGRREGKTIKLSFVCLLNQRWLFPVKATSEENNCLVGCCSATETILLFPHNLAGKFEQALTSSVFIFLHLLNK